VPIRSGCAWQALQEERVHDGKNRGVRPDGKGKRKNYSHSETGVPGQHSQSEAKVLPEVIPPEPAAELVETFFSLHDVAERTACGGSGLLFTQSLLSQTLALVLYVCFNFCAKVAWLPLASKHGI